MMIGSKPLEQNNQNQQDCTQKLKVFQALCEDFQEDLKSTLQNSTEIEANESQLQKLVDDLISQDQSHSKTSLTITPSLPNLVTKQYFTKSKGLYDLSYQSIISQSQHSHFVQSWGDDKFISKQTPHAFSAPIYPMLFRYQQAVTPQFLYAQEIYHRQYRKRMGEDQFYIDLESIEADGRTALMIKNIPNKYTQRALTDEINVKHKNQYDFFYMPLDFRCNVGYAFINFLSTKFIPRFYENFNQRRWNRFNSDKICELKYARIQGRQSLVQHFHSSGVVDPKSHKISR